MKTQLDNKKIEVFLFIELRNKEEKQDFIEKYKTMKGNVYFAGQVI